MGVKLFISWLRRRCPTALRRPPRIDHLYVDANCIVHRCAQRFYGYGDYGAGETLLVRRTVHDFYDTIWRRLLEIIGDARPRKTLYVAFDGVAPAAKEATQRARRIGAKPTTTRFDPNELTAGTQFMRAMCADVARRCERAFNGCVVSDADDAGEGEQKIMARLLHVDTPAYDTHCVYSLDSDVVIAGLLAVARRPCLTVLRDDAEYIDIRHLARRLVAGGISAVDFVALTFLIGNDFVPAMRGMTVDALDGAVTALGGMPLVRGDHRVIDARNIGVLFRALGGLSASAYATGDGSGARPIGPVDPTDAAYDYVKTMQWNLDYYSRAGEGSSWTWKYARPRAPTKRELAAIVAPMEYQFPTDDGPPTAGAYLATLLPVRNLALVPDEYHALMKRRCDDEYHGRVAVLPSPGCVCTSVGTMLRCNYEPVCLSARVFGDNH
jgi:5'-3' exonuclease